MKDQYFGDINDYRKYGLLRVLIEVSGLKLGVCWLRTQPDDRRDGEFRRYLEQPERWYHHDPELYDALKKLRSPGIKRSVLYAEEWSLLPLASYHNEFIIDGANERERYGLEASSALSDCPIIFFDPDNGMEVRSVSYGARHSSKYLYWHEVNDAFSHGHSVIVYQHFRRVPRQQFVDDMALLFRNKLSAETVYSFKTPHVVFFVVPRPEHTPLFRGVIEQVHRRWAEQIRAAHHGLHNTPLQPRSGAERYRLSQA